MWSIADLFHSTPLPESLSQLSEEVSIGENELAVSFISPTETERVDSSFTSNVLSDCDDSESMGVLSAVGTALYPGQYQCGRY